MKPSVFSRLFLGVTSEPGSSSKLSSLLDSYSVIFSLVIVPLILPLSFRRQTDSTVTNLITVDNDDFFDLSVYVVVNAILIFVEKVNLVLELRVGPKIKEPAAVDQKITNDRGKTNI